MRIRLQYDQESLTQLEDSIFRSFDSAPPRSLAGFISSVGLHFMAVALMTVLNVDVLGSPPPKRKETVVFLAQPWMLRVPEKLHYAAERKTNPPAAAGGALRRAALVAPAPAPAPAPAANTAPEAKAPPRRFELPKLPVAVPEAQTLLQPDLPLEAVARKLDKNLPSFLLWTETVRAPKPKPKQFVAPVRKQQPIAEPTLEAAPAIERPNREKQLAAIKVSGPPLPNPALAAPVSNVRPVKVFQPPTQRPTQVVSESNLPEEPVNILSVNSNPGPLKEFLEIPSVNQVAPFPAAGAAGAGNGPGGAGKSSSANGTAQAAATAAGPGNANRTPPAAAVAGVGTGAGTATGAGTGNSTFGIIGGATPNPSLAADQVIRIVQPQNGTFDLVIQTSSSDTLPDTEGILSGKPIYTVYITVGPGKRWIMQYCLPRETTPQQKAVQSTVVRLGAPPVLKAPFPVVMYRPTKLPGDSNYLILHGFIDSNGDFDKLEIIRGGEPAANREVLAQLNRWGFRAASRDGVAVRVEILLAIPTDKA